MRKTKAAVLECSRLGLLKTARVLKIKLDRLEVGLSETDDVVAELDKACGALPLGKPVVKG